MTLTCHDIHMWWKTKLFQDELSPAILLFTGEFLAKHWWLFTKAQLENQSWMIRRSKDVHPLPHNILHVVWTQTLEISDLLMSILHDSMKCCITARGRNLMSQILLIRTGWLVYQSLLAISTSLVCSRIICSRDYLSCLLPQFLWLPELIISLLHEYSSHKIGTDRSLWITIFNNHASFLYWAMTSQASRVVAS